MLEVITTSTANRNLYGGSGATVLSATPDPLNPRLCYVLILLGNGTNNLSGSGGVYKVTITVAGNDWLGGPQDYSFRTSVRASLQSEGFLVPANASVSVVVQSPNSGETAVSCTAHLMSEQTLPQVALGPVTLATSQPNYAPAKAGDAMTLTSGERSTLAGVLEAAMLNEGDATALLAAIAAKVEQFLINEGDATATMAAIAVAVRNNLATELARIDVPISTRNATAPPTVIAIRNEIDTSSTQMAAIVAEIAKIPRAATAKAAGGAVTKTNTSISPNQTLTEVIS